MEVLFRDDDWFDEQTEIFAPNSKIFHSDVSKSTISELSDKYNIHPYFVFFTIDSIASGLFDKLPSEHHEKVEKMMTPKPETVVKVTNISDVKLILSEINEDDITMHTIIYKDQDNKDRFFQSSNLELPGMIKYLPQSIPDIIKLLDE